jgi:hypothetical protein
MSNYVFKFNGGSRESNADGMTAILKFHLYVCDPDSSEETHLYQAVRNGLVNEDPTDPVANMYQCVHPVVKIFSSSRGFGCPQEYISYFFLLNPTASKMVTIYPLQFNKFNTLRNFAFKARGRFLREKEIRTLFGVNSNTYKYFKRQTNLSSRRLKELVKVGNAADSRDSLAEVQSSRVRMIRL